MDNAVIVAETPRVQPIVAERTVAGIVAAGQQGPAGATGPAGPPGIPGSPGAGFVHSQPSAEAEWIVNHNLGVRPSVAVIDTGGNEIDAAVLHMSTNQLRIYFVTPTAGFARLT